MYRFLDVKELRYERVNIGEVPKYISVSIVLENAVPNLLKVKKLAVKLYSYIPNPINIAVNDVLLVSLLLTVSIFHTLF